MSVRATAGRTSAAQLNKTELHRADMSDEEVAEWAGKGPWKPAQIEDLGWFIVAGTQEEFCDSETEAIGRAARYNRQIADREENSHIAAEQRAEAAVASESEVALVAERAD